MVLGIPNLADAGFAAQAAPDSTDILALVRGDTGDGVLSGLAVTPSSAMTVAVSAGQAVIGASIAGYAGGTVTIGTADATNPRKDIVVINNDGSVVVVAGTAAATPVKPTIGATQQILAEVYVPAGDTTVDANQITDKRVIKSSTVLPPAASDPTVPSGLAAGAVCYFNTTRLKWRLYTGAAFGWADADIDSIGALGSRLLFAGHSYMQGGGATDPDRQFGTLLGGMVRSDQIACSVGGAEAADDDMSRPGVIASTGGGVGWGGWANVLQFWQPRRGSAPYTPPGAIPIIMFGNNDFSQHKADGSGNYRTIFKEALRTIMSRLVTARIFECDDASFAYSGTGTWPAPVVTSGGFPFHFNGSGLKRQALPTSGTMIATWTVTADIEAGQYVGFGWTDPPTGDGSIAFTGTASPVASGGANFGLTKSMAGLAYAANGNTGDNKRDSANGVVIRIGPFVTSDVGKTVIMTVTGATTTAIATPAQPGVPTVNGTAGATTYNYYWIEGNENGWSASSTVRAVTTGNATLSAVNSITVPALGAFPAGVRWRALVRSNNNPAGFSSPGIVAVITTNVAVTDATPYALLPIPATLGTGRRGISFNYAQIEAASPMVRGIVCNSPRLLTYSGTMGDADVANLNTDIASVVAEFPAGQWTTADIDATMNKDATLYASDGLHPNDRGHAKIAALLYTILHALIPADTTTASYQAQVSKRVSSRALVTRRFGACTGAQDYTLPTGAAAAVDINNLLINLNAEIGEDIELSVAGLFGNEAGTGVLDFAVINTGLAVVNYTQATSELARTTFPATTAWYVNSGSAVLTHISGSIFYTVRAEDLFTVNTIPGVITFALYGFTAAGTARRLYAGGTNASVQLQISAANRGKRNNGGFNAS